MGDSDSVFWLALLVGASLTGLVWAARTNNWRRLGWIVVGVVGLPMAILTTVYYVGIPVFGGAAAASYFTAHRPLSHVAIAFIIAAVLAAVLGVLSVVTAEFYSASDLLVYLSGIAAVFASAKLGRIWGARRQKHQPA